MSSDTFTLRAVTRHRGPEPRPAEGFTPHLLLYGTLALLLFGPLAFGAVEPWSRLTFKLAAMSLFLLWGARQVIFAEVTVKYHPLYWPMLAFGGLILLQIFAGMTAYPYASWTEAKLYLAYALLFFIAVHALRSEYATRQFMLALSIFGFLLAMFAEIQDFTWNGKLYWVVKPRYATQFFGPYVNHNHYAGLIEMLAPLALLLALRDDELPSKRLLYGFMGVFMGASIFLCRSRGGMVAFTVELLLLLLLVVFRHGSKRVLAFAIAGVVGVSLLAAGWGNQTMFERLHSLERPLTEETGGLRLTIAGDSIPMWRARPLAGWGLATFEFVYPQYRSFYTDLLIDYAHNDYVQLLLETGLAGGAIAVWFLATLFRLGLRRAREWKSNIFGTAAVAALTGISGVLVHSFTDFNLHIPANAALFLVLCAVAGRPPHVPRRDTVPGVISIALAKN